MRKNTMKRLLLGLGGLTLALTAAPAAAQVGTFEFVFPPPTAEYCYTQGGYWSWDGVQYVWVPSHTICEYQ